MRKKKILKTVYLLFTLGVIALIVLLNPQAYNIGHIISQMSVKWALLAVASTILFWLSESVVLYYVTAKMAHKMGVWDTFKIVMIGLYYGALTPLASGGQPAQVFYMKRDEDIPVGQSTSVLCIKFLLFQYAVIFCAIVALIARGRYFLENHAHIFGITMIGFVIAVCLMAAMALLMIRYALLLKIGNKLITLLKKLHIIKDVEKARNSFERTMRDFRVSIDYAVKHIGQIAGISFMSVIQVFINFSATYFIYRAFGLSGSNFFDIMSLSTFLYLTISFIPLPGSSFAAEGAFLLFFSGVFPGGIISLALVLWRFLQYYSHFIVGGLFVLLDSSGVGKKKRDRYSQAT